ncbi:SDR family oxidoreductase [Halobacillus yeomjeoni]|uniref:SDR family oxidoreductase n=1 Tax=Halobacillus yeomjeoni TaxID=311194 RepID=A0A931MUB2_9BACI|nr:SDR family oxidoreductase [Halobacillus yeomjeoni]MBH0229497.1 SDR family oxidoreductase [Halobacillus yeomjeoni]
MNELTKKAAIITGASSGIGKAIAHHLAEQGADVVLAARRSERLKELAEEIQQTYEVKAKVVETDVTNKEDMERLVQVTKDEFGRVDIFVNNAGVMLLSFMKNDHVDEWDQMVDVNIKGVLYGIHASLPTMIEQGAGHIINVSSVAGHEVFPSSTVYSATKHAVRALSMGLEKELSRSGVRVTNVSPGAVDTELTDHITDGDVIDMFKNRSMEPLVADDIARAVAYAVTQPETVNVNELIVRPMHKQDSE